MFKRWPGQAQRDRDHVQIGQPHLLSSTYDQNLAQNWAPTAAAPLAASSAPSEYFETPLEILRGRLPKYRRIDDSQETGAVFRPEHERQMSANNNTSAPLPDPLRSHLRPQSELPAIPSGETQTSTSSTKASSKTYMSSLTTHIPRFQQQLAKNRKSPDTSEARFDEYCAEPGLQGAGRRAKTKSRTWDLSMEPRYRDSRAGPSGHEKSAKSKISAWGERIRKETFDTRPPWKGAGGRTSTVDPVVDTSVPRTAPQFTAVRDLPRGRINESESDNSLGMSSLPSEPSRDLSPVSMMGGRYEDDLESVPRNDSTMDYEDKDVSPLPTPSAYSPPDDLMGKRVSRRPVGLRKVSAGGHSTLTLTPDDGATTRGAPFVPLTESAAPQPPRKRDTNKNLPQMLPIPSDSKDVSRFSWTTVNTVTTSQMDSPPPSPQRVPVPTIAATMIKGHGSINKPPTPPLLDHEGGLVQKALPKAPIRTEDMTHLEALMAQEEDLTVRRQHILLSIRELEQIGNASPLEVDWKTSRASKKRLEEKRVELADVEREQHEVGFAIARAWRKADRDEGIESGLWVRKITG